MSKPTASITATIHCTTRSHDSFAAGVRNCFAPLSYGPTAPAQAAWAMGVASSSTSGSLRRPERTSASH